jgi:hypothetical protein
LVTSERGWGDTYRMLYQFLLKQLQPSLDREMELV